VPKSIEPEATLNQIAEVRPEDVRVAQTEVNQAVAAVKRAEAELKEASIRAPIAGQVLEVYTQSGEAIADEGIVDLGKTDPMEVVAEIYQSDIGKIRSGQSAIVTGEGISGELRGTFAKLGCKSASKKSSAISPDRTSIAVSLRSEFASIQRIVASLTNLQVQVAIQPQISLN
jgi:HlyD family secretion protein